MIKLEAIAGLVRRGRQVAVECGTGKDFGSLAAHALREDELERVLTSWEMAAPEVSILFARDRHLPARMRVAMDAFTNWIRKAIRECVLNRGRVNTPLTHDIREL